MAAPQELDGAVRTELPLELTEVDFIIAGGGTAGSIIAARLFDAHPKAKILVIEVGNESFQHPGVAHPALYRMNISPTSKTLKFHFAAPEPQLANRSFPVFAGQTLGGGSAVNLLMYARGQRADFDGWGAKGWSAEELLPFLNKSESYLGPARGSTHGSQGPITVSEGKFVGSTLQNDFIMAFNELGYPTAPDIQDLDTSNAVSATLRMVSQASGRRQDTAYTYLLPRLQRDQGQNLTVLVDARVVKVLFDADNRATGVLIQTNATGVSRTIHARKLVILSAGTMGSPAILERSGVGDASLLQPLGVPVISALPGVGCNYQDHPLITTTYRGAIPPPESLDSLFNGKLNLTELIRDGADILSWNGMDASAKIRPTPEEVRQFRPPLRQLWDKHFANEPSRPLGVIVCFAGVFNFSFSYPLEDQYFTLAAYSPYPQSRGFVHINNHIITNGISDELDFKTGMLSDPEGADVQVLTWLYKKQRQVAERMRCQRGQVSAGPALPSADEDGAIEKWIRETVSTPSHSLGTCKMAGRSECGVVDHLLNVHGTQGLKVADLSIAPSLVAGNTMNTAVVIGEKAVDVILQEDTSPEQATMQLPV